MPLKKGWKKMSLSVEEKLHTAFKAATAAQGKAMTDVLLEFIRDYVKQYLPGDLRARKRG